MKNILGLSFILLSANASAITTDYSALVFGNFSSPHSASMGPLAIGNDASLNGYSIMYDDVDFPATNYSLIVGGNLSYKNGRVYQGSIIAHGDISKVSENIYLGLVNNAAIEGNATLPIDFQQLKQYSINESLLLSQQDSVGTVTAKWGGIYLNGDCSSDVQIFNVNGYQLEKAHTFELECIPENATVIVNISGNKPSFKPLSNLNLSDFIPHRQQTIFNLYEATSLHLAGVAIEGLVLAPKADVKAPSGSSNVGIIANSWKGSMYLDYRPYNGQIPGKEPSPIDARLKWHWQTSDFMPEYTQVMATPLVAQLNDDNKDGVIDALDTADVVVVTFKGSQYTQPGIVRALSGINGKELWNYENGPVYSDPRNTPALADLDNDGLIDIVVSDQATNEIRIITNEGEIKKVISRNNKTTGSISIADLDGDGVAEILTGTSIYNYSSGLLYTLNGFKPDYSVFDADGDGIQNILAGGTLYDAFGNTLWSYSGHDSAWFSSIANLDNDPQPEVLISIPGTYATSHSLALLEHDGNIKWEKKNLPSHGGGAQAIGAFLHGGQVGIAYSGYEQLVMLNAQGDTVWEVDIDDSGSGKIGVTAFDFNGDGRDEVIYQDHYNVAIVDSLTGKELFKTANSTGTLWEYPIVVDLEGDNNAELIIVSNNYSSLWNSHKGVRAFESAGKAWKGATRIWNQHSYHQTNITQDGKVPLLEKNSWQKNNSYRSATIK